MTDRYSKRLLINRQLETLKASVAFSRSGGLYQLLKYIVDETLDGRGDTLKELVIGDALYGRSAPYDPRIDSAVRVEARRLRRKLSDHYAGPGRYDSVRITLPVGCYVPEFEVCAVDGPSGAADAALPSRKVYPVDLAIIPFRALSGCEQADRFADGLTDQLIYALGKRSKLKLAPRLIVFQYKDRHYTVSDAVKSMGAGAMLHGTYRSEGDRSRVTVEICDGQGFVTWSAQIDHCAGEDLHRQEALSGEIIARMPAWLLSTPHREQSQLKALS